MNDLINVDAAVKVLRALILELETRLSHPESYGVREQEQQRKLLQIRRLELADLLDQQADPGDLP